MGVIMDDKISEQKRKYYKDNRTVEQITEHYEIEKELAKRLLDAPRQERAHLASSLYDEMYRRVPQHPQHTQKNLAEDAKCALNIQMSFLQPFLKGCRTFLEVGPGDCAISLEVSKIVNSVYAVDVSSEITKVMQAPDNFNFVLSDGCSVPVEENSIDIAYSNQLMEHLHPDDACEQLENIFRALVKGGRYLCITPNRLTGPHDVSKYFDDEATGFHLKEYSVSQLYILFKAIGFSKLKTYIYFKGGYTYVPVLLLVMMEKIVLVLPKKFRKQAALGFVFKRYLNTIRMVGVK